MRHLFSICILLLMTASPAAAHAEPGTAGGLMAGFLHPLGGLDHLLAMAAVGIWGAFLGKPLVWALPVTFPIVMVAGGMLGIFGIPLAGVEQGIALSVCALGIAIALAWRAPLAIAVTLVAVFALFHGHAHGTELPAAADPEAYATGFVLATGMIHLCGIAIGCLAGTQRGTLMVRGIGLLIAVTGIWILMGSPSLA